MYKLPRCRLTTKDFSILEALLEGDARHDEAFLRLLRQKLSNATILFQEDVPSDVATIGCRVVFTVDRGFTNDRMLAHGGDDVAAERSLLISTMRGLALLGSTVGETILLERPDGGHEEIRIDKVSRRPDADGKEGWKRRDPEAAPEGRSSVVAFQARRKPSLVRPAEPPADPDDDDPGPRAA